MSKNKDFGNQGEALAVQFLSDKGFTILETNWRTGKAEIDIIAQKDNIILFVEVKTRSYNTLGNPEDFVSKHKQALMIDAATIYCEQTNHYGEVRFDVIAITKNKKDGFDLSHFEDAFFPIFED